MVPFKDQPVPKNLVSTLWCLRRCLVLAGALRDAVLRGSWFVSPGQPLEEAFPSAPLHLPVKLSIVFTTKMCFLLGLAIQIAFK